MKTFNLVSLGCPKNLVDSEVVYGLLQTSGWRGCDRPEDARVLLINTCGFIQPAVEESIEEILQLSMYKEQDHRKKLVVFGCLVQRYREKLESELPEVDLFVGTEGFLQIPDLLERLLVSEAGDRLVLTERFLMDASLPRSLSTPFYRAWLKITEGCDNNCAYCLIPSIRGRLRSRTIEDVVLEAQKLETQGVKEISLIAQDLTAYGTDLRGKSLLTALVERLLQETSLPWLRLLYLYPSGITDGLLDLMSSQPRIVPYLDIPLQHVSNPVLSRMNRRYTMEQIISLIERIRSRLANVALRTTFLVGFPGETDDDLKQLIAFVKTAQFNHVGVFRYANEEGSPAAKMAGQLSDNTKEQRLHQVIEAQAEVSEQLLKKFIGTTQDVLIEGTSAETDLLLQGRTRFQAPDIDGCVLINEGTASPGDIVEVTITEAQIYDLVGSIKDQNDR